MALVIVESYQSRMAIGTGSNEHFHDVNEPALFDSDALVLTSILGCPNCAGWVILGLERFWSPFSEVGIGLVKKWSGSVEHPAIVCFCFVTAFLK